MRIVGLDFGSKTVGVAVSDPLGITAQPVEIVRRKSENKLRQTLARIEELAKEYDGKIDIYKVDTEKEQELAAVFGIRSIPTLLFCPTDGRPQVAQGAMSKADFEKAIDELLLKKQ